MLIKKEDSRNNKVVNLRIKDGAFVLSNAPTEEFKEVSGTVLGIIWKQHRDKDHNLFILWHLRMRDEGAGESYDISFPYMSQAARTLIGSLYSSGSYGNIKIKAYRDKNGSRTTKISVYEYNQRVDYPDGLIPGKEYPTERQRTLHELVDEIDDRIQFEQDLKEEQEAYNRKYKEYAPSDPFDKFMSEYNEMRIEARDRDYEKRSNRCR